MKERIYTIPINEAFDQDVECPLCICEDKLENDALEYAVGAAMMEPDFRIETNKNGFCKNHFIRLYTLKQEKLPLALVIDTHLNEQIKEIETIFNRHRSDLKKLSSKGALEALPDRLRGKNNAAAKAAKKLLEKLKTLKDSCSVCKKMGNNMERLIENTLYLYDKEPEFKRKFLQTKGFCLKHIEDLIEKSAKELSPERQAQLLTDLFDLEIVELKRINEEVHHFTLMFDYRNAQSDWKNSKDAVPRSIEKICGSSNLKNKNANNA
ncbi:MAG: ABC transporter substrate-binding protein [Bacteroidales bacterium]|nr:ABC transporter substrate-binding protein [Bacteroidales bacterium]